MVATFILPEGNIPVPFSSLHIERGNLEWMLEGLPVDVLKSGDYKVLITGPTDAQGRIIGMNINMYPSQQTPPPQIDHRGARIASVSHVEYSLFGELSFWYSAPWHGYKITIYNKPEHV